MTLFMCYFIAVFHHDYACLQVSTLSNETERLQKEKFEQEQARMVCFHLFVICFHQCKIVQEVWHIRYNKPFHSKLLSGRTSVSKIQKKLAETSFVYRFICNSVTECLQECCARNMDEFVTQLCLLFIIANPCFILIVPFFRSVVSSRASCNFCVLISGAYQRLGKSTNEVYGRGNLYILQKNH